ncbi:class I adenylate-forming enzyme family protein [Streptomyces sp. NPDC048254]|uniref:class I adenylate-forming enzyme family protein n=1 Tax=Streptomyces sp. NPDC048254 TaxID=3365525 RepID=UPI00371EEDB8
MSAAAVSLPQRLWDLVTWRAGRTPDRVLISDNRGRALSAAAFRDAAESVAAGLAAHGVGEGTRVMWQLPTTVESVLLSVALARLGAVQNPLITVAREAELRALNEQFRPEFAVVPTRWRGFEHAATVRALGGPGLTVLTCDHTETPAGGLALPQAASPGLPPMPAHDGPRWVFTTSGSTARPKAVRHTDASVFASSNAMVEQLGIGPEDVFPMAYPYPHIGGVAWLLTALRTGARLVVLDTFDAATTPFTMADQGATLLGSATPFFHAYIAAQRAHGPEPLFPRLRLCTGGGAPIAPDLAGAVRTSLGGLGIVNGYGLTEFPIAGFPRPSDLAAQATSAWLPASGVTVRIVGPDGTEVPRGQAGELRLRGPQAFSGYLDAESTDAVDELGFVRTGDLAVLDERGLVVFTGRLKEIVVRNGENISVAEVEAVLATHPAIADVAVIALPHPRHGEICCAVVIPAPDTEPPTLSDLADHCRSAGLARYKTPERLTAIPVIPRTAMGKVQRERLRQAVLDADRSTATPLADAGAANPYPIVE